MDTDFASELWLSHCQYCIVDEDQMLFYSPMNEEKSAAQYASREVPDRESCTGDGMQGEEPVRRPRLQPSDVP